MAKAKRTRAREKVSTRPPAASGRERRQFPRFRADFEVDYRAEDTFLFAFVSNLSTMGIFVRTDSPQPPGTKLLLRFRPHGFDFPLEIEGVVQWINPLRESPEKSRSPGMGVEFRNMTAAQRRALIELVKRLAYLDDDSLAPSSDAC